jgi:hypothetical protein
VTIPPTAPGGEQPTHTLPARIALQMRDGALNEMTAFDLAVYETKPAEEGGKLLHRVDIRDVITALAIAQRNLILDVRADFEDEGPEVNADNEQWLRALTEWVVSP